MAQELGRYTAVDLAEVGHPVPAGGALDPACGDGVFLDVAARWGWGPTHGVDLDDSVLRGPRGAQLRAGDGLTDDGVRFGIVLGNPPFTLGREFARRFVEAAAVGGVVALLLPETFFSSSRDAAARDVLLRQARCVSITSVYGRDFLRTGTRARTCWSVWIRRAAPLPRGSLADDPPVLLRQPRDQEDHELAATQGSLSFVVRVPLHRLLETRRWDPRFHDPRWEDPLDRCVLPVQPLGDFIDDLVYGALGRGVRPTLQEGSGGWLYVGQATITERGVDLDRCPRIADARPFVQDRYRLRPGDLVIPRSGMGTLGKNLLCRWDGLPAGHPGEGAVVDCFNDRLSLRGISSAWVLGVLRSEAGWAQIRRVIGGVATPNLSFAQLRALRLPVPSAAVQEEAERRWQGIRRGERPFDDLRALVREALGG